MITTLDLQISDCEGVIHGWLCESMVYGNKWLCITKGSYIEVYEGNKKKLFFLCSVVIIFAVGLLFLL